MTEPGSARAPGKHARDDSLAAEQARERIFAELQRRDLRDARREATEERRRARWSARKFQRAEAIDRVWLQAEEQTKGNMFNRRGRSWDQRADPVHRPGVPRAEVRQ